MERIALITGANRGIGLEIARQLGGKPGIHVLASARTAEKADRTAALLQREKLRVTPLVLDVDDTDSIEQAFRLIEQDYGRLDILVNNAAVFFPDDGKGLDTEVSVIRQTFETNVIGPLTLCRKAIPLMRRNHYGRIVNLSSQMGALNSMSGGNPGYRISKTALNALTKILASEVHGENILINTMSPGWVRTDMGGRNAPRTPAQGADTAVWLSLLPDGGSSGRFFMDRREIDW